MRLDYIIIIVFSLGLCFLVISMDLLHKPVKKDCSISEISPDFTPEERAFCRQKVNFKKMN